MSLFPDRDERILENLRIINSRFARKDNKGAPRGIRPILFAGPYANFSLPGQAFQETGRQRFYFKQPSVIISAWASVHVAPTGAAIIADVQLNGVTVFADQTQRPTIPIGAHVSQEAVPTMFQIPADSYLTADVDQVGSALPGGDVVITVRLGGSA